MNLANCIQTRGRALLIGPTGSLYVARGYSIYRSGDGGESWELDCRVPCAGWKPRASNCSLVARLLRQNIQALRVLDDGSRVAVARDGIYRADLGEVEMRRTWAVERGSRPINLSMDGKRLLFGEYGGAEMEKTCVRIYCSEDGGRHFEIVHEFPRGDVHHIHNVAVDPYDGQYWVLAGDHGRTAGIGVLSRNCRHFDWVARGSQMVRAVMVLVRPDCLVYGSDTELEQNYIVKLDKKTAKYERITPVDGSSLYAVDLNRTAMISTCVEPSAVNKGRYSRLLTSSDGESWTSILSLAKDLWSPLLFQLGLIVLPYVQSRELAWGMFSGQALVQNHDRVSIFSL